MMKQREAVYEATHAALTAAGLSFTDGDNISLLISKEIRANIIQAVMNGFLNGTVEFKDKTSNGDKLSDSKKLLTYVSGLVSNWHRKDKRFNGNTTYTPKNPGSRTGQADPQLKALRQLLKQFAGVDAEKVKRIQKEIDERTASLKATKVKAVEIDYNVVPQDLLEALELEVE
jgi:hypothetical protein